MEVGGFDGAESEWDAFVEAQAGWTHMHRIGWRRVVRSVLGHDCPYLVARSAGELRGVLPLVSVRSRLFGRYLVSMPFLNYGGPLGGPSAIEALVSAATDMARSTDVDLLELRCRGALPIDLPDSGRKITVTLPLSPGDPEGLWTRFTSKLRNKIKRSRKEGLEVRFGADEIPAYFEVFRRHMRDLGTPTLPGRLFHSIHEAFPDSSWFAVAYLDGSPIAAGCALLWDREVEMTWSAGLKEFNRIRPTMWLYWSVMRRACEEGYETFNFGRCSPGGGTHAFKRSWTGTRDERLFWYYHAAGARYATPTPNDGAYSLGPRIWRRVPLPVATALGPHIVRFVP